MANIFSKWWFWLIIIGVILAIAAVISFVSRRKSEWWIWTLLVLGVIIASAGVLVGTAFTDKTLEDMKYEAMDRMTTANSAP